MEQSSFKAVCIGGGCGASQVMLGLRPYTDDITGIIAVTDSGRSTGKIRIAMDVPAPGDIRNALVALAQGDETLIRLFQHRFDSDKLNELDGMAFGNLFLAALTQMLGSFEQAIQEASRLLNLKGRVLPVTLYSTHLCAELEDGGIVEEEFNVRALGKPPIKRAFLKESYIEAYTDCVSAIRQADIVTIGPGSLYTTIVACLLTKGIAEAIADTTALRVFICNTTSQPGQTDGLSLSQHVTEVQRYLRDNSLDYVVVNSGMPAGEAAERNGREGICLLAPTDTEIERIRAAGVEAVVADVAERQAEARALWQKQDTVRHDPARLGELLAGLVHKRHR